MSKSVLDKFCEVVKAIDKIDSNKKDCSITASEFDALIADDSDAIKTLTGGELTTDWKSFKEKLCIELSNWGFDPTPSPGRGGPIAISKVRLREDIGEEIAKAIFSRDSGDFIKVLEEQLSVLYKLFENATSNINYSDAQKGFTAYTKRNKSFKFKPGRGTDFTKKITEFVYGTENKKQDEISLGEKILPLLRGRFDGIKIDHTQASRKAGKYQNIDFIGYQIEKGISEDRIDIYAFELKASNKITSVSEAISQAINYKASSNYSYIIIPMFDEEHFDKERFKTYVQLCSNNGIGIITILFDEDDSKSITPISVDEVLPACFDDIQDKTFVLSFIEQQSREMCPLCKRIVEKNDVRKGCGWSVTIGTDESGDSKCMKQIMEKAMTKFAQ